jgi:hypothetical protein
MAGGLLVNLVAAGGWTSIMAAVWKFRGQFRGSKVDVEGEDDEPPGGGRHRA